MSRWCSEAPLPMVAARYDGIVQSRDRQGAVLRYKSIAEVPANCAWGDADGKTLHTIARTGLYRIKLKVAGVRP